MAVLSPVMGPAMYPVMSGIGSLGVGGDVSIDSAIRALFAKYSAFGGMWDFTDMATLFQDSGGTTPVTAVTQPVGLALDKRLGLVRGPERAPATTSTAGWAPVNCTLAAVGGELELTATATGVCFADYVLTGTSAAGNYELTCVARLGQAAGAAYISAAYGDVPYSAPCTTTAETKLRLIKLSKTAGNELFRIRFDATVIGQKAYFSLLSAKEIPGNHLHQPTSGKRPLYNGAGITPDGVDDFLVTASNLDLTACDKAVVGMGYTKADDAPRIQMELSDNVNDNAGTFFSLSGIDAGGYQASRARGSEAATLQARFDSAIGNGYGAHIGRHSIPGSLSEVWWNGTKGTNSTQYKGTGNFGNYPLYLLSRGGVGIFSNTPTRRAIVLAPPVASAQVSDDDIELIRLWLMEGAV